MPDITILLVFIPTFFFVSITPGMCMSLAMTLGMTIGIRKTAWMMLGEVLGVALVALLSVIGVAAIFIQYPRAFTVFKLIGGAYIIYLGIVLWRTPVRLTLQTRSTTTQKLPLFIQGFSTAVANPKGWAFMIALLPPFIQADKSFSIQVSVLISIIMLSELTCMYLYAIGGKSLNHFLNKNDKRQWINRIGGGLLTLVGVWLAAS
ncbi:MAG: LysE family translocator [Glaciecola sp.]